jgi:small-conductance mechanosensitive channel
MQHAFSYHKPKTIQALRYHFLARIEIKLLMIAVNIFAVVAALLFFVKKIRPEPFFLGTFIWIVLMATIWYILPYTIFNKAGTFKEHFIVHFMGNVIQLENEKGHVEWPYASFKKWLESPHFFHLYFDDKSFFLIPKDGMNNELETAIKKLLQAQISR